MMGKDGVCSPNLFCELILPVSKFLYLNQEGWELSVMVEGRNVFTPCGGCQRKGVNHVCFKQACLGARALWPWEQYRTISVLFPSYLWPGRTALGPGCDLTSSIPPAASKVGWESRRAFTLLSCSGKIAGTHWKLFTWQKGTLRDMLLFFLWVSCGDGAQELNVGLSKWYLLSMLLTISTSHFVVIPKPTEVHCRVPLAYVGLGPYSSIQFVFNCTRNGQRWA